MSFLFPVVRRIAYAEAADESVSSILQSLCARTFDDVRVFRRTATVCSCAETSSIVFGRLNNHCELRNFAKVAMYSLFLYPWLVLWIDGLFLSCLGCVWLEE